jgi:hypothetical protein
MMLCIENQPPASEEFILDLIHVSNTTNCRNCNYMQIRAFFLFLSEMLQKSVVYQDTSWLRLSVAAIVLDNSKVCSSYINRSLARMQYNVRQWL